MANIDLETLIAPMSIDEFLTNHWRKQFLHQQGADSLLETLKGVLGSFEVKDLVGKSHSVDAMSYANGLTDRQNGVSCDKALELYDKGYTLYFDLQKVAPECCQFPHAIMNQLGVRIAHACCSIFASRKNSGLKIHFDNNENFTVQLRGRKVWTIWPNRDVRNPSHCFRTDEPLVDPTSGMYIDPTVREIDFGRGQDVEMVPGSVLYHEAGSWHMTRADDAESISLNMCIQPLRYFDLLFGALQARLYSQPAIRDDLPPGRWDPNHNDFLQGLNQAIQAARKAVEELDPKDAMTICAVRTGITGDIPSMARACPVPLNAKTPLKRNSLVSFDLIQDNQKRFLHVFAFLGQFSRRIVLEVPEKLLGACVAATSCRTPFTPRRLANGGENLADVIEVCSALVASGAFRVSAS